jgi:hypothetical protein
VLAGGAARTHVLVPRGLRFFQGLAARSLETTTSAIMAVRPVVPYVGPVARLLGLLWPANSFLRLLAAQLLLYCLEAR